MNHKHNIYIYIDIEYSGCVLLHIASYGSISSIQMLTPAADQRGPAQGKVTQLNLSRLRHYEFGPVALKKHLSSQKKFDASTITPSFLLFSNCSLRLRRSVLPLSIWCIAALCIATHVLECHRVA